MSTDFDVIIVGSGPAGVSAAFPLVEAGLKVLMVDGGKSVADIFPTDDFISRRKKDDQWQWMVGNDFEALRDTQMSSPKFRVPAYKDALTGFAEKNHIDSGSFMAVGSLATGGLSTLWGAGVARWSGKDLAAFPFPAEALDASYQSVARRIGISGREEDDLSDYFAVDAWAQEPIANGRLQRYLFEKYKQKQDELSRMGWRAGRSRVAVLSQPHGGRNACTGTGNCLWGCGQGAIYSATHDIATLQQHAHFHLQPNFIVDAVERGAVVSKSGQRITARKILLAAGTLATTRLALAALGHNAPVALQSCPTAAFMLWLPRFLGTAADVSFGLGQLSFAFTVKETGIFGSTFATTGLPMSEFARHMPLRRRYGVDVLTAMLSSCLVGNLFMPGHLSAATARLQQNKSLSIQGGYAECVPELMQSASRTLAKAFRTLRAIVLPGSFTIGAPGSDVHYAGTLPMNKNPQIAETDANGTIHGITDMHIVDGACLPALSEKSHTLTIMANADRIGKILAKELRT